MTDPERTPSRTYRPLSRLLAAALLAAWTLASWPELRASVHNRFALYAVLAGVVAASLGLALRPVGRALYAAVVRPPDAAFVGFCTVVGAALTAWVQRVPMHRQVVSGDACMYVTQARALAHFELAMPVSAPRLAHAAKFLLEGVDGRLHGVFVPGYPLFLAPFVRFDAFFAAAMFTTALHTLAHWALARAALREAFPDRFPERLSLLLVLPSFARALETADLISHAFTGSLAALAVVAALKLRERPTLARAAALGLCAGWVFGARMLDGFVLAAVLSFALAGPALRRAIGARHVAVALLCALPFVALVAAQQKAATGSFRRATAVEYADRSDWPLHCLHLGFGWEVGCQVEHAAERASFGPDGYTPDDGLRLVQERTGLHGAEIFGVAAVTLAGFAGVVAAPTFEALLVALFPVLLTFAYALFYYGNGLMHGARHVFPATAFDAILVARALALLSRRAPASLRASPEVAAGALALGMLCLAAVAHPPRWVAGLAATDQNQRIRIDLRALLREHHITRGIVIFPDVHSYLPAIDPWTDGDHLVIVHDDLAGEQDLRRAYPALPVWLVMRDRRVLSVRSATPPPGLQLEFERAWPTFQRPHGLAAAIVHTWECCGIHTSGDRALFLFDAHPGSTLDVPFDLITAGTFTLRLDGVVANDYGRYEISIDGAPLITWDGYSAERHFAQGVPSAPRALAAGPHRFTARCVGKAPESAGYFATFDALVAGSP